MSLSSSHFAETEAIDLAEQYSGHKLASYCVIYGTAGDRKAICKTLKGIVMNAVCEDLGHKMLLSLLCFTDDTQMLKKMLIDEVLFVFRTTVHYCPPYLPKDIKRCFVLLPPFIPKLTEPGNTPLTNKITS
uniref:Uncharacterized protein n=1 Tax=Paramoeba aestuarina TaxID=180227 RepID=A0A7S4PDA7_9EUKA